MKKANWGIIGLGNVAQEFADGFVGLKNACIKGIASNNLIRLSEFKKRFSVNESYCFSNYQDLIDCKEIDIIYISLPHSLPLSLSHSIISVTLCVRSCNANQQ